MKLIHVIGMGAMFKEGFSTMNLENFKEERMGDILNVVGFSEECAEACYHTRSCRQDRTSQGTYCKAYGNNRKGMFMLR